MSRPRWCRDTDSASTSTVTNGTKTWKPNHHRWLPLEKVVSGPPWAIPWSCPSLCQWSKSWWLTLRPHRTLNGIRTLELRGGVLLGRPGDGWRNVLFSPQVYVFLYFLLLCLHLHLLLLLHRLHLCALITRSWREAQSVQKLAIYRHESSGILSWDWGMLAKNAR